MLHSLSLLSASTLSQAAFAAMATLSPRRGKITVEASEVCAGASSLGSPPPQYSPALSRLLKDLEGASGSGDGANEEGGEDGGGRIVGKICFTEMDIGSKRELHSVFERLAPLRGDSSSFDATCQVTRLICR